MKLTIRELKELIKEQIEEAGELAAAAKGAPIRHASSNVDKQGMPPPGSIELDPRDPITSGKSAPSRSRGLEEQMEEAQELAKAYKAAGSPAPRPYPEPIGRAAHPARQGVPPPGSIELDPKDPITPGKSWRDSPAGQRDKWLSGEHDRELARGSLYPVADLEEQVEASATVRENIRKMVREALDDLGDPDCYLCHRMCEPCPDHCEPEDRPAAVRGAARVAAERPRYQSLISAGAKVVRTEAKKGLPPWLKPGFKNKKKKDEEGKESLKDKKNKNSKLDEARLLNLIKQTIKQNLNENNVSDKHRLKILINTMKMNPAMAGVMGGPSKKEAEKMLRAEFGYTDKQIAAIKNEHLAKTAQKK